MHAVCVMLLCCKYTAPQEVLSLHWWQWHHLFWCDSIPPLPPSSALPLTGGGCSKWILSPLLLSCSALPSCNPPPPPPPTPPHHHPHHHSVTATLIGTWCRCRCCLTPQIPAATSSLWQQPSAAAAAAALPAASATMLLARSCLLSHCSTTAVALHQEPHSHPHKASSQP